MNYRQAIGKKAVVCLLLLSIMNLKREIFNGISGGKLAFKGSREISSFLRLRPSDKSALRRAISELEDEGKIMRTRDGVYCTPAQAGAFTGKVQGSDRGFAFIIPDERTSGDFFVPKKSVNGAYDGDRVLAAPVRGTEDEAYVISVLERGIKRVIGTLWRDGRSYYVLPDNPRQPEIFVPAALIGGAKNGDKVVCDITSFPHGKAPGGKVTEVLGEEGDFYAEELSIIRDHGLYEEFAEDTLEEAERVSRRKIVPYGREDLRDKLVFTIDGEDTRDIDDAVSLERDGSNYILGVHIADVSGYVERGSALDEEAYARGTSVYFPDRVLPMLPKALSNGACSLNEGEDRYALSCIMTFTEEGEKISARVCESVIRSRHKTTYTEISAICGGDEKIYPDLNGVVSDMKELCLCLEKRRAGAGHVNLDVHEAHITVENGEIIIPPLERGESTLSHRIIEQFMVSANECVAELLASKRSPCLYRIHEKPDAEKAATFFAFLRDLGINARGDCDDLEPSDFSRILAEAEDKPTFGVINKVMLRTMKKARYCEENLGHFGLASQCYCHFTSPIRRYPDLFVHRAVKEILHGCEGGGKLAEIAHSAAIDCSERERNADEAERAVDDLYKLAYMSERMGQEFEATVSGVTSFGVFCELDNTVEGLIPLEDLEGGDYEYFAEKFLLKGAKKSYRLGQSVKVRATAADLQTRRVYFKDIT